MKRHRTAQVDTLLNRSPKKNALRCSCCSDPTDRGVVRRNAPWLTVCLPPLLQAWVLGIIAPQSIREAILSLARAAKGGCSPIR